MKCCMIISVMSLILSLLQEGGGVGFTPIMGVLRGGQLPFLDLPAALVSLSGLEKGLKFRQLAWESSPLAKQRC